MSLEDYQLIYERIAGDVDAALQAGINAAQRKNVGYQRSPALTEVAAIVRYWRTQLSAVRNSIGLSQCTVSFATKHSLPTAVIPERNIYP